MRSTKSLPWKRDERTAAEKAIYTMLSVSGAASNLKVDIAAFFAALRTFNALLSKFWHHIHNFTRLNVNEKSHT